jgi:hypothetical protein
LTGFGLAGVGVPSVIFAYPNRGPPAGQEDPDESDRAGISTGPSL